MPKPPALRLGVNVDHVATLRNARGGDRSQRRAHRIGPAAAARVAQGSDVIDIDAKAEWRSF